MTEKDITHIMEKLHCSREEAIDVLKTDNDINHGANPFPLTKEQEKVVKKMCGTGTRKVKGQTVYKFNKDKPKKGNPVKEILINKLFEFVKQELDAGSTVLNPTRQVGFSYDGKQYELTLIEKRKPKG